MKDTPRGPYFHDNAYIPTIRMRLAILAAKR